ncbi:MAG: hypothetical protein U5L00_02275 [Desulfovermiculus sp.]|nr:hypothetical protein [Desulfovermiculus sp.]
MSSNRETLRQSIITCMESSGRPLGYRDLSIMLGISEKDLPAHIPHVAKSLRTQGRRLVIFPSTCKRCGYEFAKRQKVTQPSRCPKCKSERIDPPLFTIG